MKEVIIEKNTQLIKFFHTIKDLVSKIAFVTMFVTSVTVLMLDY